MTISASFINWKAASWTVGIHALLLLLLFFMRYSVSSPADIGLGMEVNLGSSDEGFGIAQPMSVNLPAPAGMISGGRAMKSQSYIPEHILTSEDMDAPVIRTDRGVQENAIGGRSEGSSSDAAPETPAPQPKYLYSGRSGDGGNSAGTNQAGGGEGNIEGTGDRGVAGGTAGSSNYTGNPGNGTGGISHNLAGRTISPSRFVAEFNEAGKVVIRVKVDREGHIISSTIKSSSSRHLTKIALQKLEQAKFSKSESAAPEQIGDVTFVFKIRAN